MPEIKHNFTSGKMNKDLDERLVPNGEYVHAENIQVSTSEGSNLGSVQNLLSNYKLPLNFDYPTDFVCVGSIADEKNDALYWFIADNGNWQPEYIASNLGDPFPPAIPIAVGSPEYSIYDCKGYLPRFRLETNGDSIIRYKASTDILTESIQYVVTDIKNLTVNLIASDIVVPNLSAGSFGVNLNSAEHRYFVGFQEIQAIKVGMKVQKITVLDPPAAIGDPFTIVDEADYGLNGREVTTTDFVTGAFTLKGDVPTFLNTYVSQNQGIHAPNSVIAITFIDEHRALNFNPLANNITGINIIDDMLFWTDNVNEPKKINIQNCINGTPAGSYTRLINEENDIFLSNNVPLGLEHVTVIKKAPTKAPTYELKTGRDKEDTTVSPALVYTGAITITTDLPTQIDDIIDSDGLVGNPYDFSTVQVGDTLELRIPEDLYGNQDFELLWGDPNDEPTVVLKEFDVNGTNPPPTPITDFRIKGKIKGTGPNDFEAATGTPVVVDLEITNISGFPPGPEEGYSERKYAIDLFQQTERLFEFKFPRFATRYKYRDGQYSSFSSFTPVAFVPGSFDYHPRKGYNIGMTNRLTEVKLKNFRLNDMPLDVEQIDILYKEEGSPNVFLLDSVSANQASYNVNSWEDDVYIINDETINSAISSNQLLRSFDNVPKRALAQEVSGSRIIYGNYTQGFDVTVEEGGVTKPYSPKFKPSIISTGASDINGNSLGFTPDQTSAVRSIKSLREYQIGVVFLDEYGRETPVISNPSGTFKIEKELCGKANRLQVGFSGSYPKQMKYYKFYIKETSGEYYNMAMSRWYDAEDGNVWISFPSTDRNKVDIDTFLILKKAAEATEPVQDKARYKVIAIENEAPDYIKTSKKKIVDVRQTSTNDSLFFTTIAGNDTPAQGNDLIAVKYAPFKDPAGRDLQDIQKEGALYVSFSLANGAATSDRYRVVSVSTDRDIVNNSSNTPGTGGSDAFYYFKLDKKLGADVNFISDDATGNSSTEIISGATLNVFLYKVENSPQFDGRFFVKIDKDDVFEKHLSINFSSVDNDFRAIRSKEVFMMRNWGDHRKTHSSKATGHGHDYSSTHAKIKYTADAGTESRSAYNHHFGKFACYFRMYDFGGWNPAANDASGIPAPTDEYSGGWEAGYWSGITQQYGLSAAPLTGVEIDACRYKFRTGGDGIDPVIDVSNWNASDAVSPFTPTDWLDGTIFAGLSNWNTLDVQGNSISHGPINATNVPPSFFHTYPYNFQWANNYSVGSFNFYGFWDVSTFSREDRAWLEEWWAYTGITINDNHRSVHGVPYSGAIQVGTENNNRGGWGVNRIKSDYYLRNSGHIDTGYNPATDSFNPSQTENRDYEVWFIDYGGYRGQGATTGTFGNHDWSTYPVSSGVSNMGSYGKGIYGNAANNTSNSVFRMNLTLGPILHKNDDGNKVGECQRSTTSAANTATQDHVSDVWNIGLAAGGNEFYSDNSTVDFIQGLVGNASWRWREDPNGTIYNIQFNSSGNDGVTHRNILRYWAGITYSTGTTTDRNERVTYGGGNYGNLGPHPTVNDVSGADIGGWSYHYCGAQLSPNFNKQYSFANEVENNGSLNWIPTADPTYTSLQPEIGPILGGLSTENGTGLVTVGNAVNNTAPSTTSQGIDEYHIIVTGASFEAAESAPGVPFKIGPGLIVTKHGSNDLHGYNQPTSPTPNSDNTVPLANPYLVIRKIVQNSSGNYELYLTGYLEALDVTHCFNPGDGVTLHVAQPTMNGYSENSATRISIQKSWTGMGAFTEGSNGDYSEKVCKTLLLAVGYTMEFLEPWSDSADLPENPAIWETEPKETTDLDIYYEASDLIPISLDSDTSRSMLSLQQDDRHIPMGTFENCKIRTNPNWLSSVSTYHGFDNYEIVAIENDTIWMSGGIPAPNALETAFNGTTTPVYNKFSDVSSSQRKVDIFLPDGTIFTVVVDNVVRASGESGYRGLVLKPTTYRGTHSLNYYNCFSFLNGVESNRIRDGFNLPFLSNGVVASTTLETEAYKEEHRKYGLIFSGIYNSVSNVNELNQFVAAENITKDVNPIYGSIQKLFSRDTDLITLCEDKVLKILANKDAVFNADGNPQLTANINVLGQTIPFVGEYGISRNPESFASESYRAYFADKQRGAIVRLSKDGLTPISNHGMQDWFRDNLKIGGKIIGSYDDRKKEYNVTIKQFIDDDVNSFYQGLYTVTFKEAIKGWTSFKSFNIMEDGISMANDYYTFSEGYIWRHHSTDNFDSIYNTFYGTPYNSSITLLLNDDPSTVKSFKTLNYEGTQARVVPEQNIYGQQLDDNQYHNKFPINGWWSSSTNTDLQSANAVHFLKKESKWFNYIKGGPAIAKSAGGVAGIDDAAFNFQGIGIVNSDSFVSLTGTPGPGS